MTFRYKKASRPTFEENERQDMTRELIELRSALSDINVFLHAERQQVTRLHAENEQLQVKWAAIVMLSLLLAAEEIQNVFGKCPLVRLPVV